MMKAENQQHCSGNAPAGNGSAVRRKRVLLLLLLLFGGFVALGLGEAFCRMAGYLPSAAEPDDELVWRFVPGARHRSTVEGYSDDVFNRHGFRDYEYEVAKKAGVVRVAVLGDSFTVGFGVPLASNFVKRAEALLTQDAESHIEVLNFARSGMGTVEELITLRRDVLPFDPDVVCLVFFPGNDVPDAHPATAGTTMRPFAHLDGDQLTIRYDFRQARGFRARKWINPIKRRSALVSLIAKRYHRWRVKRRKTNVHIPASARASPPPINSLFTETPDPMIQMAFEINLAVLEVIHNLCLEHRAEFCLVVLPTGFLYESDESLEDQQIERFRVDRLLNSWCEKRSVPMLSMGEFMWPAVQNGQPLHFMSGGVPGHLNAKGHGMAGEITAQFIQKVLTQRKR